MIIATNSTTATIAATTTTADSGRADSVLDLLSGPSRLVTTIELGDSVDFYLATAVRRA